LRAYVKDDTAVMVVPPDDPTALANALREALARRQAPGSRRDFLEERRAELSWAAYAARYEARMVAELRTKV
jgi:glycosyltransferase involved in cell wall biosynthesis